MLALESVEKSFGARPILDNITWQIPANARIGLVGANGAGKTTFLRVLVGEEEIDRGRVIRPRDVNVGFLPQEIALSERSGTLIETVLKGRQDLLDAEAELARLETRLADSESLRAQYGTLQERFRQQGGYEFRSRAREIAVGIGFKESDFERPITEFSGGWQMRALLARLLFRKPNLLLLDEPTNHLDLRSIEWLERFLGRYEGTVLLVSHDRYFLNRMVDHIAELDRGELNVWKGNYDAYRIQKAEQRERLAAAAARQEREIEQVEAFIDRFRSKATKAAQVQSRIKQLEKVERIEGPRAESKTVQFRFPQPARLVKQVVAGKQLTRRFGEKVVFDGLDIAVHRGERVALVGPNGAGKTTLLRLLAGVDRPDSGDVEWGANIQVAYFAQHALEALDPHRTVLEEVASAATMETSGMVRDFLGAFRFTGDDVAKRISVLSGGEKSRVALCKLLLNPAGLLLLDEPTNHLDIATVQVLEEAMREFTGSIVLVSHDRFFVNEVATHVVHMEHGTSVSYPGNYDDYRRMRELGEVEAPTDTDITESTPTSRRDTRRLLAELRARKASELKDRKREFERLESEIARLEARGAEIRTLMAQPDVYADGARMKALIAEERAGEAALEDAMVRWEALGEEIEAVESRYATEEAGLKE